MVTFLDFSVVPSLQAACSDNEWLTDKFNLANCRRMLLPEPTGVAVTRLISEGTAWMEHCNPEGWEVLTWLTLYVIRAYASHCFVWSIWHRQGWPPRVRGAIADRFRSDDLVCCILDKYPVCRRLNFVSWLVEDFSRLDVVVNHVSGAKLDITRNEPDYIAGGQKPPRRPLDGTHARARESPGCRQRRLLRNSLDCVVALQ